MQGHHEKAALGNHAEVSDERWPSPMADMHQLSPFALYTRQYMLKLRDKSHRLFSKKLDNEALIAVDLNGKWTGDSPRSNLVQMQWLSILLVNLSFHLNMLTLRTSFKGNLLKQSLVAGFCRIL